MNFKDFDFNPQYIERLKWFNYLLSIGLYIFSRKEEGIECLYK